MCGRVGVCLSLPDPHVLPITHLLSSGMGVRAWAGWRVCFSLSNPHFLLISPFLAFRRAFHHVLMAWVVLCCVVLCCVVVCCVVLCCAYVRRGVRVGRLCRH